MKTPCVDGCWRSSPRTQPANWNPSVTQALALMERRLLIQRAIAPATSGRLKRTLDEFPEAPRKQIEALYLASLSRFPTSEEHELLRAFYEKGDAAERPRRLGDIFWTLLNSAEFRWNH